MGFFYFGMLLGWFVVLWFVVKTIVWRISVRHKRLLTIIVIVIGFPLPVADEIIGLIQFKKLCERQMIYKDPEMGKKRGARLIYVAHEKTKIYGKALPMTSGIVEFVSENDHALMLRYAVFKAGQGLLARNFQLNEGGNPLIFTGVCYPQEESTLFVEYKIIN